MERRVPNAERKHRLNREIMVPQVRLNGVENSNRIFHLQLFQDNHGHPHWMDYIRQTTFGAGITGSSILSLVCIFGKGERLFQSLSFMNRIFIQFQHKFVPNLSCYFSL